MKIIGMRIEKYIGESCIQTEEGFDYEPTELNRYILYGYLENKKHVEITMWQTDGECGSGWTTASWGHISVKYVRQAGTFSYYPKYELIVDDIFPDCESEESFSIENEVFTFHSDGGCKYYPSGGVTVDMSLFTRGIRTLEKRPVWIFKGQSNIGKSYLASKLSDLEVYETDSSSELPEVITASVVVAGNKYHFSISEIQERLFGECDVRTVDFC